MPLTPKLSSNQRGQHQHSHPNPSRPSKTLGHNTRTEEVTAGEMEIPMETRMGGNPNGNGGNGGPNRSPPPPLFGQGPPPGPPPGPPDDDDPNDQADEDDQGDGNDGATPRRRDKQRVKEADEVKIMSLPQSLNWRAWRSNTILAVISAAGRHDDKTLEWIMQVETHQTDDLEAPGVGWVTLDRTLAAALANTSHGELGNKLTLHSNA